ncbi:MAG: dipeptidase [Pseudomonadota bacterium]
MKRVLLGLSVCIIVALTLFTWLAPAYVDDQFNTPRPHALYTVNAEAKALYDALPGIADMHVDTLLWKRDLLKRNTRGHVDVPRAIGGKMAIQVFGAVTKSPKGQNYEANSDASDNITLLAMAQRWPPRTWFSLRERALYQAEKLSRFANGSGGQLVFARSQMDLERVLQRQAKGESVTAGFMGLEGAHALEGELGNVDVLFGAGFRMLGLAHFFDNEVAGSVHGLQKYGLTPLGRDVVLRAQSLGMMIDVAHASHKAIADVLDISSAPLIFSHGGVKGTCDTNRNLTDEEIRAIAATGGLIGLGAWDAAACGETPADLARAMAHVRKLVGAQHVAIGSDFDGAVKSAFTIAEFDALVQALLAEGFSSEEVEAVMFGNVVRVFRTVLPKL